MKSRVQLAVALAMCWACLTWSALAQQGSGFRFLEVKIVDPDGKPVADASVEVTIDSMSFPMPTDDKGMISLNVPSGGASMLQLKVQKDGFAAVSGNWGSGEEIPAEIEIKLAPGLEIGGIVHDEQGNPIEGVTVSALNSVPAGARGQLQSTLSGQLGVTDAEGRWKTSAAEQAGPVMLQVTHPDYVNDGRAHAVGYEQLRAMDHVLTLKKGIEVRGTITDADGNPLVGVKVALGDNRQQRAQLKNTDAEGEYLFGNVPSGQTLVTVFSPEFAPDLRQISPVKGMDPVDFQLRPGKPLRIRVTDAEGQPVSNVRVYLNEWRGTHALDGIGIPDRTGQDGTFLWQNAPADDLIVAFYHENLMSSNSHSLKAGEEQHEIELGPALVVNGTVVDAATGKPVELFNAIEGIRFDAQRPDVYYERYNLVTGRDGKFQMKFTDPRAAHLVRIEAHGYRPANSREIMDNEGEVTLEFKLEPGQGPAGVVKLPDGSPAAGARIAMASAGQQIYLTNGEAQDDQESIHLVADDEGKYQLPFPDSNYAAVFVHDGGWAQLTGEELEATPDVKLQKWARLEGVAKVGAEPATGTRLNLHSLERVIHTADRPHIYWSYNVAVTDDQGNFAMERLRAGEAMVGRMVTYGTGNMNMSTFSHSVPVTLKAGETATVKIGGSGRKVAGKAKLPAEYEGPAPWAMGHIQFQAQATPTNAAGNFFYELGKAMTRANQGEALAEVTVQVNRTYSGAFNEAGEFLVDDVLPGTYSYHVMLYELPQGDNFQFNTLGTANGAFTVPAEGEGTVEVGEITLNLPPQRNTGTLQFQALPAAE